MKTVTLYSRARNEVTLPDALAACGALLAGGTVLLYGFRDCLFGRVDADGTVKLGTGRPDSMDEVWEARAFTESAELRWQRTDAAGRGKAVLLGESPLPEEFGDPLDDLKGLEWIEQAYLLWGYPTGQSSQGGWTELAEARVGALLVPADSSTNGVQLVVREYVGEVQHGNAAVVEERLVRLEPAPGGGP